MKKTAITSPVPIIILPDLVQEIEAQGCTVSHIVSAGVVPVRQSVVSPGQRGEAMSPAFSVLFRSHENSPDSLTVQGNPVQVKYAEESQ